MANAYEKGETVRITGTFTVNDSYSISQVDTVVLSASSSLAIADAYSICTIDGVVITHVPAGVIGHVQGANSSTHGGAGGDSRTNAVLGVDAALGSVTGSDTGTN